MADNNFEPKLDSIALDESSSSSSPPGDPYYAHTMVDPATLLYAMQETPHSALDSPCRSSATVVGGQHFVFPSVSYNGSHQSGGNGYHSVSSPPASSNAYPTTPHAVVFSPNPALHTMPADSTTTTHGCYGMGGGGQTTPYKNGAYQQLGVLAPQQPMEHRRSIDNGSLYNDIHGNGGLMVKGEDLDAGYYQHAPGVMRSASTSDFPFVCPKLGEDEMFMKYAKVSPCDL
uniref:Uncharacterized protein n=1 Tax=Romanomermis culicivorax TaxID=13658 RepID=A0A915J8V4_ROMCU